MATLGVSEKWDACGAWPPMVLWRGEREVGLMLRLLGAEPLASCRSASLRTSVEMKACNCLSATHLGTDTALLLEVQRHVVCTQLLQCAALL